MTIENTKDRDPLTHFLGMRGDGGQSGYIRSMESAGQQQLVNSDQLPNSSPWDELAELGFVKGDPVAGDALFTHATLPAGWIREASDHAMHSHIVDERGIRRVNVFYKAAFYDRRADAHVLNVAWDFVSDLLYGTEPVALPEKWSVMTGAERAEFFRILERERDESREDIARHPQFDSSGRYTKRIARAEAALALRQQEQ